MKSLLCTTAALALLTCNAHAAVWSFDAPVGVLGPSFVYGDGVAGDPTITVFAEGPGAPLLTAKDDGPDEQGLGLTNSPFHDGEITPGSWVSFDLTSLVGRVTSATLSFAANSTSGGDIWHLYGSNAAGTLGTSLLAGTGDAAVDLLGVIGTWAFLQASADSGPTGNGSVLASELDANVAPTPASEPSALGLLVVGLGMTMIGLAGKWRQPRA